MDQEDIGLSESKRRRFMVEFMAEAVKILGERGRSLQLVADELGVHANQLCGWRNEILATGSAEVLAQAKIGGRRVAASETRE